MATPNTVIHALPIMTFRGIEAPPYDDASFSFSHTHGERDYPYIDRAAHEWTGLNPEQLTFTLFFLNSLQAKAYPELWDQWWPALQDGSPGDLRHPVIGPRKVVVKGGDVQLTARNTAGIVCKVTFSTTILDPEEEQAQFSQSLNLQAAAKKADAAAKDAGVPLPPSQEGVTSLFDIVKMIDSFLFAAELEVLGLCNKVQSMIGEMVDFVEKRILIEPTFYPARDALLALWNAVEDVKGLVGAKQARKTGSFLTTSATTLDAFARDRGNTLAEVAGLNPNALATPTIPAGTMLKFYK